MALLTDLIAYYKLDESAGTNAADATGNYDGTNNGAALGGTGILNTSYNFDGSDYVDVTKMGDLGANLGNGFSISMWVKTTESAVKDLFGQENTDGTPLLSIIWNAKETTAAETGKIAVFCQDVDGQDLLGAMSTVNNAWRDGGWAHVVVTVDGPNNALLFYIDGSVQTTTYALQTTPDNFENGEHTFYLGANHISSGARRPIVGEVDEVGVWNRVLTSDEVSSLYNSGSGLAYPFGEGATPKSQIFLL